MSNSRFRSSSFPVLGLAAAALALLSGCAATSAHRPPAAACAGGAPDVVCTAQGAVRGVSEGETLAFKGMPYAQAPVGPLRWKPPVAATAWEGVRDGSQHGAICPQQLGSEVKGNEDCLFVNVWRPRTPPERLLPVMVWLTGGGNHQFSGQGSGGFGGVVYDGAQVVPEGVVYVSYNLRLGALGFLAHGSLDAESAHQVSGNYGSLDQVEMLRWVRKNIAAFGGDPERVFLYGTSSGGGNLCALMSSPLTKGLMHGVAMQSSVPTGCELQTLDEARRGVGTRVVRTLGCGDAPDVAACLRSRSAAEVVAAVPGNFSVLPRLYGPNVDGHVFPEQPIARIAAKRHVPLPVIVGASTGETSPWADSAGRITDAASYAAALETVFGKPAVEPILARYPATAYATPRAAFARATTDAQFLCTSRRVAHALARAQGPGVYRYVFEHTLDNDPALKAQGASHTIEHPFLFAWKGSYKPNAADLAIQQLMTGYWTRMAKAGDPNGGAAPKWRAVTPGEDAHLVLGPTVETRSGDAGANCEFWDRLELKRPRL